MADFVEFLRNKQRRAASTPDQRLRIAADAGLIILPESGHERSSVTDLPPVFVPGRPLSKIVAVTFPCADVVLAKAARNEGLIAAL